MVMHNLVLQRFDKETENFLSEHSVPASLSEAVQRLAGVDEDHWAGGWGIEDSKVGSIIRLLGLPLRADVDTTEWFLSTVE